MRDMIKPLPVPENVKVKDNMLHLISY